MGSHTLLLDSANVLVEFITLVKLTQHRSRQICSSSGSAVMQHAYPAKTVGYECPTLKAKGSGCQVHGAAAEWGAGTASPQPMLLVPLLQVLLQMLYESSGNLPSLLAMGSPASQRSKESSFSWRKKIEQLLIYSLFGKYALRTEASEIPWSPDQAMSLLSRSSSSEP